MANPSMPKTPDCTGSWIDISTMMARKSMCDKCRATVDFTVSDLEQMTAPIEHMPPLSKPRKRFIPWRIVIWMVLSITFAAFYNSCAGQ